MPIGPDDFYQESFTSGIGVLDDESQGVYRVEQSHKVVVFRCRFMLLTTPLEDLHTVRMIAERLGFFAPHSALEPWRGCCRYQERSGQGAHERHSLYRCRHLCHPKQSFWLGLRMVLIVPVGFWVRVESVYNAGGGAKIFSLKLCISAPVPTPVAPVCSLPAV